MNNPGLVDAHRHFTFQVSDPRDLIGELDSDGIEKTVLFGYHGYAYEEPYAQDTEIQKLAQRFPQRIIPFLCDIDFRDSGLTKYLETKLSQGIFRGIGEILVGHEPIKKMFFQDLSLTDPRVLNVFKIAANFDIPVLIHVDTPFLEEFEKVLILCPATRFICPHIAYDFLSVYGGSELGIDRVKRLLDTYANLMFDISLWKISPVYLLSEPWLELLKRYRDRFMFGTDMTDHYNNQSIWMHGYRRILDSLDPASSKAIGRENILRICQKDAH